MQSPKLQAEIYKSSLMMIAINEQALLINILTLWRRVYEKDSEIESL